MLCYCGRASEIRFSIVVTTDVSDQRWTDSWNRTIATLCETKHTGRHTEHLLT